MRPRTPVVLLTSTLRGHSWQALLSGTTIATHTAAFVTSRQHNGMACEDVIILRQRQDVYERAKAMHPERWNNRATRNWQPIREVHLNPEKNKVQPVALAEAA